MYNKYVFNYTIFLILVVVKNSLGHDNLGIGRGVTYLEFGGYRTTSSPWEELSMGEDILVRLTTH